jgi:uncharacterized protein YegP (UPF0339 family)
VWQFDVYEDITGRYRWRLFAANGRRVATASESFTSGALALAAAQRFKANAERAYDFQTYVDAGENHRWRAKARNGQTVASSGEPYYSQNVARAAAENVRANAPAAELR